MHYHYIVLACLLDRVLSSPIPQTRGDPIIGAIMPSDLPSGAPVWGMGQGMERPGPSATENLVVVTTPTTTSTSTSSPTTSTTDPAMVPGARFIGFGNVSVNTSSTSSSTTSTTPAAAMGAAQVRTSPASHVVTKRNED